MKIAIDGFEIDGNFTGVGRYLRNLLDGILKFDKKNSYTLFKRGETDPFQKDNLKIVTLPSSKSHTRWQNTDLLRSLKNEQFDLFFSPNHTVPLFYKGRSFMTVHDVSWRGVPRDFSWKERFSRDIRTRISLKKCEKIFTVSDYSKMEMIRFYKTPSEKIIPIHSGIEKSFFRETEEQINTFKNKYDLTGYLSIGFLGSMFKRRHIMELIDAFNILKKNFKIKLFLIGQIFDKKVEKYFNDPAIIHIKRIPEKEINSFYSSIDLFAYLSEYEGFGFPPLESLMCGTVPLLLRSSSLKEIFNDIALFVDKPDPDIISKKAAGFLTNKEDYNKIIFMGFEKTRDLFSWDRVAKDYLNHFFIN